MTVSKHQWTLLYGFYLGHFKNVWIDWIPVLVNVTRWLLAYQSQDNAQRRMWRHAVSNPSLLGWQRALHWRSACSQQTTSQSGLLRQPRTLNDASILPDSQLSSTMTRQPPSCCRRRAELMVSNHCRPPNVVDTLQTIDKAFISCLLMLISIDVITSVKSITLARLGRLVFRLI